MKSLNGFMAIAALYFMFNQEVYAQNDTLTQVQEITEKSFSDTLDYRKNIPMELAEKVMKPENLSNDSFISSLEKLGDSLKDKGILIVVEDTYIRNVVFGGEVYRLVFRDGNNKGVIDEEDRLELVIKKDDGQDFDYKGDIVLNTNYSYYCDEDIGDGYVDAGADFFDNTKIIGCDDWRGCWLFDDLLFPNKIDKINDIYFIRMDYIKYALGDEGNQK